MLQPETRFCTKCRKEFPLSNFHKNPKGKYGKSAKCKACVNIEAQDFRTRHPVKTAAKRFKVSIQEIEKVYYRTVCDICNAPYKERRRHNIDHCHRTGKIWGLLCDDCNMGLGKFKDSPELLEKAKQYLERNNA